MKKYLALVVGVLFVGIGIFMYLNNQRLMRVCTEEADAIVVDIREDFAADDECTNMMYYPIIEYFDGMKMVREEMKKGSSTSEYNVGDRIKVMYNPDKTEEFIVIGDSSSNIFSIIFIGLGVLAAGLGIVTLLKRE